MFNKKLKNELKEVLKRIELLENKLGYKRDVSYSVVFGYQDIEPTGIFLKIEELEKQLGIKWVDETNTFTGYKKNKNGK